METALRTFWWDNPFGTAVYAYGSSCGNVASTRSCSTPRSNGRTSSFVYVRQSEGTDLVSLLSVPWGYLDCPVLGFPPPAMSGVQTCYFSFLGPDPPRLRWFSFTSDTYIA